ncbi:MAG: hypothetical protein R2761_24025 [Acidimicrobiales bacterium]
MSGLHPGIGARSARDSGPSLMTGPAGSTGEMMDGATNSVTSGPALGALRHPDQTVAALSPHGLTVVWAEPERARVVADAIERSLAWQLPTLYATPADAGDGGAELAPFRFVRVAGTLAIGDAARVLALTDELEAARESVPAHVAELSESLAETGAVARAAEQRRDELKEILATHAATLASSPEARSIVGLHRRIASLEIDRRSHTTTDVTAIHQAYYALAAVDPGSLPVDPVAAALADRWERLLADEARLDATEPRHPLIDQLQELQTKLRAAEAVLAEAEAEVNRPRPNAIDREEIDRLHAAAEEAEERAGRFGARRSDEDDARSREAAYLARFGFQSYSEYLLSGALDPLAAAVARRHGAGQKVNAIRKMIGEVEASMSPSAARRALLDDAEALAAEVAARFGEIDAGDDVAVALRSVRQPPQAWHDLIEVLAEAGHEPTDDPVAVAHELIEAARRHNAPADAIDAELVELRGRLAAYDPEVVGRHGSLGVVAGELIRIDRMYEGIMAQVTDLRSRLGKELSRDQQVLVALDQIQRLERELTELTGRSRLERDRAGDATSPAGMVEAAVTEAAGDPRSPIVALFDVQIDQAAPGVGAMLTECVDRLVTLAAERQIVVVTPIEGLVHAAHTRGDVQLSGFN